MTVLKYSDLADSGLYVKVTDRGSTTSANAVASLVNGIVPANQLPVGSGGSGVSSFNGRTGVVSLLASDVPGLDAAKITSGVIDAARLPAGTGGGSSLYTFRVNYNGTTPSNVSDLPTGWSAVVAGSIVTVTHMAGTYPKIMTFLGYNNDSSPATLKYRLPSAANEMIIVEATKNNTFAFAVSTSITASSLSQYALVNVSF